ncbi:hypothetical protein F5Y15DRAFT_370627 [Xylariaceae sp. FL0016]|nr:hypothetical protein F5Y15DRAFT_370627 [Xylariaceae sp. FL0016]
MLALLVEIWVWYAVTSAVVLGRMISRRMLHGSFKKMGWDDYIMVVAFIGYTALLVGVKILTEVPTNLINPENPVELTPESIKQRIYGSKIVIVVEQMQMLCIWSLKACLLILYSRLTMSLKHNVVVKFTAGYVALSYVVMQILFFGAWCRPFNHYWMVPAPSINCSAETNHMITNAIFNISTDLMIIFIPMPVFLQAQLPMKRKAVLMGVFALGFFTILAAALSKYYSLGSPYGIDWTYWYIREASTAVIVANLPMTWTLLQRVFAVRSFHGKSSGRGTADVTNRFRSNYGNLTSHSRHERNARKIKDPNDISPSESQEQITLQPLKIYQQQEIHITSEEVSNNSGRQSPENVFPSNDGRSGGTYDGKGPHGEPEMGVVTTVGGGV